ncbi:hypothetical protein OUZ56_002924 [Daphnia magna]|uniref:Uncharacterized protein n=1 Tax=Daphnia magna TaxID=35525 RepID=A0ABR0A771_9CRUS|nr:hypothetical protein OUZ56_002924 [Daphnia magna]
MMRLDNIESVQLGSERAGKGRTSGTIEMIQRKKADDISFEFSKRASSKIKQHTGRNELLLLARRSYKTSM